MRSVKLPDIDIVTLHPPTDARIFERQAKSLAKQSSRVRIIAPKVPGIVLPDTGIYFILVNAKNNYLYKIFITPYKLYRKTRYQPGGVIYIHDLLLLYLVPLFKLHHQHCFYDVHEDYKKLILRREEIPKLFRRFVSQLVACYEKVFTGMCDGIIAAVHPLEEITNKRRGIAVYNFPTIKTIMQGITLSTGITGRPHDLVHLGVLSNARFEFLCKIMKMLCDNNTKIQILLIGLREQQIVSVKRILPPRNVTVFPWVSHEKIIPLLVKCKIGIGIWPVLWPHLEFAIPVKMFEYMAAGCNIITSYLPGLDRLLRNEDKKYVETIESEDPKEYSAKVLKLLSDPETMANNSEKLQAAILSNYSWEDEENRLIDYFANIIETRK